MIYTNGPSVFFSILLEGDSNVEGVRGSICSAKGTEWQKNPIVSLLVGERVNFGSKIYRLVLCQRCIN